MTKKDNTVGPDEPGNPVEFEHPIAPQARNNTQPIPRDAEIDEIERRIRAQKVKPLNKKVDSNSSTDDLVEAAQEALGSLLDADDAVYDPAIKTRSETVDRIMELIRLKMELGS